MHQLRLIRITSGTDSSIGCLDLDGKFLCFTLEDEPRPEKVHGETRIPAGVYPLALRYSPKFSKRYLHDVIWVKEVPGFEFILIHSGNTDDDTEGCILVGNGAMFTPEGSNGVIVGGSSLVAYQRIYAQLSPLILNGTLPNIEVYDSVDDVPKINAL